MSRLALFLLGSPHLERDGVPVQLTRRAAMALLAYLAMTGPGPSGQGHSRDALATLLWPDMDQSQARHGLRTALASLRGALGEGWLEVDREKVGLNPRAEASAGAEGELWLDVAAFRERLEAARAHGHPPEQVCPACLSSLAEAVALYRDDFLAGFSLPGSPTYEEWQFFESEGLRRQLAGALERLAGGYSTQGRHEEAISYARRWVALDPFHEPAHRLLMQLYAQSGQRAAALRQYAECERILWEELGARPEEETARLHRAIREQREPSAAGRDLQAIVSLPSEPQGLRAPGQGLPAQSTPFIGREVQLAEVRDLLTRPEVRLLTLTGVGGSGKTRLALQVAADLQDAFPDGVYFVPLASICDPALVVPTIARALGVRESGDTPLLESLKYALRDKERLLVIDNYEQVAETAPALSELLAGARRLRLLVTSRAPLHVYAEQQYEVPPMEVPEPRSLPSLERLGQAEAVRLFVQRAQQVRPGFTLNEENAPAVAEICARLDGLPLAIELAAARIGLFSPESILPHLDDRLGFLTGGPRDQPDRQRTLRATLGWSYELLDDDERRLFRRLAVFVGGGSLPAIEAIAMDRAPPPQNRSSLDLLAALVDQSLIQASTTGGPRFGMLETIRQYAAERLEESGEGDAMRDRHAAIYASALERWGTDLKCGRQLAALAEADADLDNARAAWGWAVARGKLAWLDHALEGLCYSLEWRGHLQEGWTVCARTVERLEAGVLREGQAAASGVRLRVLARSLSWRGRFGLWLGRSELAEGSYQRALALLDDPALGHQDTRAERADVLWRMADKAAATDLELARDLAQRSLDLYQAIGDRWGMALALLLLSSAAFGRGAFDEMGRFSEASLELFRALGDRSGTAFCLGWRAMRADHLGQLEEAEGEAREALEIARQIGDAILILTALDVWTTALHDSGRFAEARSGREEGLALARSQGNRWLEAYWMVFLGDATRHLGAYEQARALAQAALPLSRQVGNQITAAVCCMLLGRLALAQGSYEAAQEWLGQSLAFHRERGGGWWLAEALATSAWIARGLGRSAQAREDLRAALGMAAESRRQNTALQSLAARALLLIDEGQVERAVALYALLSRYSYVANSRWFADVTGVHVAAAAEALPPEVVQAAQERGRGGDLWAAVQENLAELDAAASRTVG